MEPNDLASFPAWAAWPHLQCHPQQTKLGKPADAGIAKAAHALLLH